MIYERNGAEFENICEINLILKEATEIYQIPTSEVDPSILYQLAKRQIIRESKNE